MMYGSDMGWGMGFGWLFMVLFWAFAVFGIVSVVQWFAGKTGKPALRKTSGDPSRTTSERNDRHGRFRAHDR